MDEEIGNWNENYWLLRAEPIPADETATPLGDGDKIIRVAHIAAPKPAPGGASPAAAANNNSSSAAAAADGGGGGEGGGAAAAVAEVEVEVEGGADAAAAAAAPEGSQGGESEKGMSEKEMSETAKEKVCESGCPSKAGSDRQSKQLPTLVRGALLHFV